MKNKIINSMRSIALDSINRAGQGHIGMAIGSAPITYSIIGENLKFVKEDPKWMNRDKFVLSAGHASMSQYSIMHFMGLLSVEDMKNHKVYGSKTPSHPEIDMFDYVDATTGPLGQGVAMAVGMAISERYLSKKYNRTNLPIIDHNVFALHGDGCLQEGVALEAIQLAGTMQLDKLIIIQDYNAVQIDSRTEEVNNINIIDFFKSQKFDTFEVTDPTPENISNAIALAKLSDKPSFIQVHTVIAPGTPFENQSNGHNGTLSETQTAEFKRKWGLKNETPFEYDADVYESAEKLWEPKNAQYKAWNVLVEEYQIKYPDVYKELLDIYNDENHIDLSQVEFTESDVATRNYIAPIMEYLEKETANFIGGSADLKAATKVGFSKDVKDGGKNIKYGIREFAMGAINNGIHLASGLRTVDATFLTFADYMKPAMRLGSLMKIPSVHVFTHDSYQVGGDGPTHQPIDQIPMLRSMPNMTVIRPCDESEMKGAFQYALTAKNEQVSIIACRQPIKSFNTLKSNEFKSAYIIKDSVNFQATLLATGSEVELAVRVYEELKEEGINVRVISVPNLQGLVNDDELARALLLDRAPMLAIEASSDSYWFRLSKYNKINAHLAKDFGHSAPGDVIYEKHGFNSTNIKKMVKELI
ncbi:transketolase family protein [Mycoplasma todarodis]|uniref:transketolase n=1 Tax=Mycoplasma todarodis TaxID=1937191 RepID=A0A4R0XLK2_9MOLU|nr:transketolase [Mycoplasma todarodis]TCG11566.1 transketolase [Mycoplasma todarodis]